MRTARTGSRDDSHGDIERDREMSDDVPLYDQVIESLRAIEQDTDAPPTRAELLKIAHIKALIMIGQCIEETIQ
jgi:hypothetical protein